MRGLALFALIVSSSASADLLQQAIPGLYVPPAPATFGQNSCYSTTVDHGRVDPSPGGRTGCDLGVLIDEPTRVQQCAAGYYLLGISTPSSLKYGDCGSRARINYTYTCCMR